MAEAVFCLPGNFTGDNWRCSRSTNRGGALMQLGIHHIETLIYLLGPIGQVSGRFAHFGTPGEVDAMGIAEAPERFLDCIFQATGVYDPAITRKILEAQPPHRKSVDKWRESLSQEQIRQIEELCFEEMQRYGYTPEFATGQKRLGSLKRGWEMFREYGHEIPWDLDWWRRKRVLQRFLRTIRG